MAGRHRRQGHLIPADSEIELAIILGGNTAREIAALELCQTAFPSACIWITGPEMNENLMDVCESRLGKDLERLRIDYTAMDTLSNFTSLAEDVKAGGFKNVAILTSKSHLLRGRLVGSIILYNYGVERIVPVPIAHRGDGASSESYVKVVRDVCRALLWLVGIDPTRAVIRMFRPELLVDHQRKVRNLTFRGERSLQRLDDIGPVDN